MSDNFEVTTISAKQMARITDECLKDEAMHERMAGREVTEKQVACLKKFGVELTGHPDCDRAQASALIGLLKVGRDWGMEIVKTWRTWGWAK